jgi:integrase
MRDASLNVIKPYKLFSFYYIIPSTMDLDKLFTDKNISSSSKNLYIKNLTRLNGGEIKNNVNFLKDLDSIHQKIEKYKPNTRRSYIISIVSLLKELTKTSPRKYQKLYDTYYKLMEDLNKQLKTNNEKSVKEKENWISQEEVMKKLEELKKIIPTLGKKLSEEQFYELQKLLLLGLYSLQKPRRNKDYQLMKIYKRPPVYPIIDLGGNTIDLQENVLDLKNNKFIFANYKTKGKYSTQIIDINPELQEIIDVYLKYHPTYKKNGGKDFPYLIVNFQGQEYKNNNDMTRLMYRIFNKKVGATMLRHIFLTDKYKNVLSDMKQDTEAMGTSVDTAQNHYIKNE